MPGFVRNLMANPAVFLASTLGLMFVLGLKVLAKRRRPVAGEREK